MKKILTLVGFGLGIFLIIVLYENYIPHKRTDTKYLFDTLYKDTLRVDTCLTDTLKNAPHKRDI